MMPERDKLVPPARLVPDVPLPPYAYVSGRWPHPLSDPAGHSYGQPPADTAALDPADWRQARPYLMGCDLFNHGYYWEAHETWEAVWQACGRSGTAADFLKGLIKLAAAGVKVREGRPEGVRRHGARAAELFGSVQATTSAARYMGLDVGQLIAFAGRLAEGPEVPSSAEAASQTTADVEIVLPLVLWPVG